MLKRIGLAMMILINVVVLGTFSANIHGTIYVDLALKQFGTPFQLSLPVGFSLGWLFGVLSIGFYVLKLVNERRVLRRSLRMSESEVTSLRNLPLSDAD